MWGASEESLEAEHARLQPPDRAENVMLAHFGASAIDLTSPDGSPITKPRAPVAQLDRAPDYESGGQEFESLRARQSTHRQTLNFPLPLRLGGAAVCSWFANFVRGEFSKLKMACSASPRVRAR